MDLGIIETVLDSALRLSIPLLAACLAGLWSERSGVVDIGLEGKMLVAAFAAAAGAYASGSAWIGLLAGIAASVAFAHDATHPTLESYIAKHGRLSSIEELDNHRIVTFGEPIPTAIADVNWLETAGRSDGSRRTAHLQINDLLAIKRAVRRGAGIAAVWFNPEHLPRPSNEDGVAEIDALTPARDVGRVLLERLP